MGHGSTFTFTTRFESYEGDLATVSSAENIAEQPEKDTLSILLAEDNETNRFHLLRVLSDAGHTVDAATTRTEAVTMADARHYDLILIDIYMPEMDGTVAAQVIRTMNRPSAQTPIVALTANAMVGDRQHYLSKGMDEYVSKPVDTNALFSAIWQVVQPRRMAIAYP